MSTIAASDLRLDYALYPRQRVDPANVDALVDALRMGATLPPIIAWEKTYQVVDGFHRLTAQREHHAGGYFEVEVEWRSYVSEADAFAEAIRLNAAHGLRLSRDDHGRIVERAKRLGMTEEAVSTLVQTPVARLRKQPTRGHAITKGSPTITRRAVSSASSVVFSGQAREEAIRAENALDASVSTALRDLATGMTPDREAGPGHLPVVLRNVQETRSTGGAALRLALLDAAALFVWWAARTPSTDS